MASFIAKIFGGGKKKSAPAPQPAPVPQPPKREDADLKAQALARKKKKDATQTVFGSPLGVSGEAEVARKRLTGQ